MMKLGAVLVLLAVIHGEVLSSPHLAPVQHQSHRIKRIHSDSYHKQDGFLKRILHIGSKSHPGLVRRQEGTCNHVPSPCGQNGVCIESSYEESGYFCSCDMGWGGQKCEIEDICASSSPCQNGGYCYLSSMNTENTQSYECACDPGYSGRNCEHKCHLSLLFSEFDNMRYSGTTVDVTRCRSQVDELVKNMEASLDAKDGNNCYCEIWNYENAGSLLTDTERWTEQTCNQMAFSGAECKDKTIVKCYAIVNKVYEVLYNDYTKRKRAVSPQVTQKLINDGLVCIKEVQETKIPWPAECSMEKYTFEQPLEMTKMTWTLEVQGCDMEKVVGSCDDPFQPGGECTFSEEDWPIKLANDFLDCAFASAATYSECAELMQHREMLFQYVMDNQQYMCPVSEGVWARTGCTNTPPWQPQTDGSKRTLKKEVDEGKEKKDVAKLVKLLQRALDESYRN